MISSPDAQRGERGRRRTVADRGALVGEVLRPRRVRELDRRQELVEPGECGVGDVVQHDHRPRLPVDVGQRMIDPTVGDRANRRAAHSTARRCNQACTSVVAPNALISRSSITPPAPYGRNRSPSPPAASTRHRGAGELLIDHVVVGHAELHGMAPCVPAELVALADDSPPERCALSVASLRPIAKNVAGTECADEEVEHRLRDAGCGSVVEREGDDRCRHSGRSTSPPGWRANRSGLGTVHGTVGIPRPTPESRALVVGERLLDLGAGVHHERPVLGDGLADRATLQDEAFDCGVTGSHFDGCRRCARRRRSTRRAGDRRSAASRPRRSRPSASRRDARSAASSTTHRRRAATPRSPPRLRHGPPTSSVAAMPAWRRRELPATTVTLPPSNSTTGNVVGPQHREVRLDHLVGRRKVEPDLEQLGRVGFDGVDQRETSRCARCRHRL